MSEQKSIELGGANRIDMLHGPMQKKILLFALPLAAGSILQQLFNAADVAVAGRYAGDAALAAVGGNGPVVNFFLNLFLGISLGANVLIAQYIGQGRKEKISRAVHSAIMVALLCGIFMAVLGQVIAEPVLRLINTPEDVMPGAILYMKIYFAGAPFILLYNFGAAILRSFGDTRRPLYILIITGILNVGMNLFFVIVCHMGVAGVALATVIANFLSCAAVLWLLHRESEEIRFEWKKLKLSREQAAGIFRLGIPAGIQQSIFSLSNILIQSGINSFGTEAEAGSAAAVNYEFFTYFITSGFTQATMTFVSQNYGAGQMERCRKAFRIALVYGLVLSFLSSFLFVGFRYSFLEIYNTNPEVIAFGCIRMIHVELWEGLICFYDITSGAMRGMGRSMIPAVLTIFGVCVMRVVWIYTVFAWSHTFATLMDVYPFTWIVTSAMMLPAYLLVRRKEERLAAVRIHRCAE